MRKAPKVKLSRDGISKHFRRKALLMAIFSLALIVLGAVVGIVGPLVMSYLE
jgi:hypothetical protein